MLARKREGSREGFSKALLFLLFFELLRVMINKLNQLGTLSTSQQGHTDIDAF